MRRIVNLPSALGLAAIVFAGGVSAAMAQVTATVVLKNGQRHTGGNLAYRVDNRQVVLRTSQAEEPRIPVDQVAYVDFGGSADPSNLNLSGSQEAVVMRNGSIIRGQVIELGHTDKANTSSPFLVIIRAESGEERRLQANEVARVYFAGGSTAGTSGSGGDSATSPANGQKVTVSGKNQWTNTGIVVQRGERLMFNASGEIRIAGPNSPANSVAGASETNQANPLPSAATGALIGRIGNGQPFLIGNQSQVPAPASGQLFLGINDSHLPDNEGEFQVEVRRGAGSRRR